MKKDTDGHDAPAGWKINSWHLKGTKEEKGFPYLRDMLCQPEAQENTGGIKVNLSGFCNFQVLIW